MNPVFARLVLLALAVWLLRAVGPETRGSWALATNLLAAVTIQAGLALGGVRLVGWSLLAGLFWDFTTFSPLGHYALVIGAVGLLVHSQRGWWKGASAGEQAAGSVLAAVAFFVLDHLFHGMETRTWNWPFPLSVAMILAGVVNGLAAVPMGWWLEREHRPAMSPRRSRRIS